MSAVQRLSSVQLICVDLQTSAGFYESALGFTRVGETSIEAAALSELIRIPDATARVITLRLGSQVIELADVHPRGRIYPADVPGWSPFFQHFAIVVSDMRAAHAQLSAHAGWTAISTDGPQVLPVSSGEVTAYKFRDPEGHPLELISFPRSSMPAHWRTIAAGGYLGIDHSAISVADTARSIRFYERLGLRRAGGSLNIGPAQEKLDAVAQAVVEVTALEPRACAAPHIELLCYRGAFQRGRHRSEPNDIAATRLVLSVEGRGILDEFCAQNPDAHFSGPVRFESGMTRALLRDPDGHFICLEASS